MTRPTSDLWRLCKRTVQYRYLTKSTTADDLVTSLVCPRLMITPKNERSIQRMDLLGSDGGGVLWSAGPSPGVLNQVRPPCTPSGYKGSLSIGDCLNGAVCLAVPVATNKPSDRTSKSSEVPSAAANSVQGTSPLDARLSPFRTVTAEWKVWLHLTRLSRVTRSLTIYCS